MKSKLGLLLVLTAAIGILSACSTQARKAESTGDSAGEKAIASLRRVQAATQIGPDLQSYTAIVIEAKALVNDANREMQPGVMLEQINEVMDAYSDAASLWANHKSFNSHYPPASIWKVKYDIPEKEFKSEVLDLKSYYLDPSDAVPKMWEFANRRLNKLP